MPIYVEIMGVQGAIKGTGPNGQWGALSFSWGVTDPRDATTGLASGKRQHKPFILMLDFSPNIAALMTAIATNETLKQVVVYLVSDDGATYGEILLTNAALSEFDMSSGGDRPTESLWFTYQSIEFSADGSVYRDNWEAVT